MWRCFIHIFIVVVVALRVALCCETFLISHNAYFSACLVVVVNFPFTLVSGRICHTKGDTNSSWKSSFRSIECLHATEHITITGGNKNQLIAFPKLHFHFAFDGDAMKDKPNYVIFNPYTCDYAMLCYAIYPTENPHPNQYVWIVCSNFWTRLIIASNWLTMRNQDI